MNIRDISKPVTAASLNESLEKRFGKRVKLEDFSLDQLYNARNKLRTSLSQIETNESFDSVNTSDTYQKNKLFLDVLIAEIAEREAVQINEKAESEAQQKAAGAALAAKRGEIPVSDLQGASKEMYKMSKKDLEDYAGTKHKNIPAKKESVTKEGAADTKAKMKKIVSNFRPLTDEEKVVKAFSYKPGREFASVPVIITENPDADEMYGPFASYIWSERSGEMGHFYYHPDLENAVREVKQHIKDEVELGDPDPAPGQQRLPFEEDFDNMRPDSVPDYDGNDLDYEGGMAYKQLSTIEDAADELGEIISANENLPEWVQKKIILSMSYIDTARDYMKSAGKVDDQERGLSTESVIREGAEDQAEIVMAAKNMVDKVTSWMEDTAEMQTESMLDLNDSIRDELGENEAQQFTDTVKPALESLYGSLEETRQTLVNGVQLVAGEEVEDMPGNDLEADMDMDMEPTVDQDDELDLDTDDDDFAASEPAAGGEEEAGREKRESIQRAHRLATMLSSKKK
jgi:hypothetical protein